MSGITLDQLAAQEENTQIPGIEEMQTEVVTVEQQPSRIMELLSRVLTAETGPGGVEEYVDHPVNYNSSKGLAQLIRGLSGVFGNLNLAVIDIAIGAMRFSKERGGVIEGQRVHVGE